MMCLKPSYGVDSSQDGTILRIFIETWQMSGYCTIIQVNNRWYWLKRIRDEFAESEIDPKAS